MFENSIYVSVWKTRQILELDRFGHREPKEIASYKDVRTLHVYHRQRQPEIEHPCRVKNGGCQQICVTAYNNSKPSAQCMCQDGFRVSRGGKCLASKQTEFLIFSKGRPPAIKGISLSSKSIDQQGMIPISGVSRPTAIDYDVRTQYIYFSDPPKYDNCYTILLVRVEIFKLKTIFGSSAVSTIRLTPTKQSQLAIQNKYYLSSSNAL